MSASAGKIYRFIDESGTSTMSKTLPAYAAQQGYDILDETSLQLIKRVYSKEEFIKVQEKKAAIEQAEAKKQQQRDAIIKARKEQRIKDRNLLDRYPTDDVLIRARNTELEYRDTQIAKLKVRLSESKEKLKELQSKAAELELNGKGVSENHADHIKAAQNNIEHYKASIKQSIIDKAKLAEQYQEDLLRLRKLLAAIKK